jgi:anti-sigma regulatory factor (Ser/Thr protein kinase)
MEPGIDNTASGHTPHAHGGAVGNRGGVLTSVRALEQSRALAHVPGSGRQGETITAEQWPLRNFIELGALPSAVPCARLHTRQVLWEWNQTGLIEAAELIVSELMTNAITATQPLDSADSVQLWLLSDNQRTQILVGDASANPPRRIDTDGDAEAGRGLLLVETLSSNWGWYATGRHRTAKVVWAELR